MAITLKLKDMVFRIKDVKGAVHDFGWDSIYGYEGEQCGVFARIESDNDDLILTNNSGYGFKGINGDLEIEVFEKKKEDAINENQTDHD